MMVMIRLRILIVNIRRVGVISYLCFLCCPLMFEFTVVYSGRLLRVI